MTDDLRPDELPDGLRERMGALRAHAEAVPSAGLADVRHRRARRQRNAMAGAGLAVVAVVGSAAFWLAPSPQDRSIEPLAPTRTVAPQSTTSAATPTPTPAATPTPTPAATSAATSGTGAGTAAPATTTGRADSTTATATPAAPGTPAPVTIAVGPDSIVTATELAAVGLPTVGAEFGDPDGMPTLPALCSTGSWQEQYSAPDAFVSGGYPVDGGSLTEDVLGYGDAIAANAALVKLKDDARACPTLNEFATVSVTAVGSSIGDEFVLFALDQESGQTGAITRSWLVIARVDNVLVETALDRGSGSPADSSADEATIRAAAAAAVEHIRGT